MANLDQQLSADIQISVAGVGSDGPAPIRAESHPNETAGYQPASCGTRSLISDCSAKAPERVPPPVGVPSHLDTIVFGGGRRW